MTLTPFRVASLLCRALAFWLWWSVGLDFVGVVSGAIGFGLLGSASQNGLSLLGSIGAALMLSLFNAGISAAMTGRGAFDEETVRTSAKLSIEERALVQGCGGLLLLVHGALEFISWSLFYVFQGFGGFGSALTAPLILATLEVGLGLFFAFRLGLKRLLPK